MSWSILNSSCSAHAKQTSRLGKKQVVSAVVPQAFRDADSSPHHTGWASPVRRCPFHLAFLLSCGSWRHYLTLNLTEGGSLRDWCRGFRPTSRHEVPLGFLSCKHALPPSGAGLGPRSWREVFSRVRADWEKPSAPPGFRFSLVLFCPLAVPCESGSRRFRVGGFPFAFWPALAFPLDGAGWRKRRPRASARQACVHSAVWAPRRLGQCYPGAAPSGVTVPRWAMPPRLWGGTGSTPPWHLSRVGCPDVILGRQCLQILPYYCGVKAKLQQTAISQHQMSCFAWLCMVLGPLVMYKDFSYFIFQQQQSFRSNCQFNGANDHQNKENYTVTLSVFRKGNNLRSLWCWALSFFPQCSRNSHSHKKANQEPQGHFIFNVLLQAGKLSIASLLVQSDQSRK